MQKSRFERAVYGAGVLAFGLVGCSAPVDEAGGAAPSGAGTSSTGGGGTFAAGGSSAGSGGTSAVGGVTGGGTTSQGGTITAGSAGSAGSATTGGTSGGAATCAPSAIGGAAPSDQEPGTWLDVTVPEMGITETFDGVESALVDPARPSDVYVTTDVRGLFKSTDYGCTFSKVNTGENGDKVDDSRSVYSAIDPDTCRDPNTPATIYVTGMFGPGGIFKSTNGGVDWIDAWETNIYAPDGTTNISTDVGGDLAQVFVLGTKDHLIATLHSYQGTGENNGVFESTDGGGKWIVKKANTFQFQPHSDALYPFGDSVWMVFPGLGSENHEMHRTTDAGVTWSDLGDPETVSLGRCVTRAGSTYYSGSDIGGIWKSTDNGVSWIDIPGTGGWVGWVVVTPSTLYAAQGHFAAPTLVHASLDDDQTWITDPTPPAMTDNSWDAKATFDGTHWIIIAPQGNAGVWRYVEP